MLPNQISHFITLGDSLSDRGTLKERFIFFNLISMAKLSGLKNHSPLGRFTNGMAWMDHFGAQVANQFLVDELKEKTFLNEKKRTPSEAIEISDAVLFKRYFKKIEIPVDPFKSSEISDGLIYEDQRVLKIIRSSYDLHHDLYIKFKGREFVRCYTEGGLSSYDYSWKLTTKISLFLKRLILSKLHQMRERLLEYDKAHKIPHQYKAETLIFEWSGANDLITVNDRPTMAEADLAIEARIANVDALIQHGYRHFVLFNLPDLSLTPRFQNKSEKARLNAFDCTNYFNKRLHKACERLQRMYPHCSVNVFDVNSSFKEVYAHPEKYGLEKDKLKSAYVHSEDFRIHSDRTSPANGYMFWDDIHPTSTVHALIAENIMRTYKDQYHFKSPSAVLRDDKLEICEADLKASFILKYRQIFLKEESGFLGHFRRSNINLYSSSLEDILFHALYGGGNRTCKVLKRLHWITDEGKIKLNIPALIQAKENVEMRRQSLVSANV